MTNSKKKNVNVIGVFQKISKAFIASMALLTVCGLLQGIASLFSNANIVALLPFLNNSVIQYVASLLNKAGATVLSYLPLIYAVTIAFSWANEDKEHACFGALVGYIAFLTSMNILISSFPSVKAMFPSSSIGSTLGIETINCGVLGGILVGIVTGVIHNKYKDNKLPMAFAFFSGVRLIPFLAIVAMMLIGQVFPFVWLPLCKAINSFANSVANMGALAPYVYGTVEKLLIPTGLHQIWNSVLLDTAASGTFTWASGTVIEGVRPAFFQSLLEGLPANTTATTLAAFLRGGQMPYTVFVAPAIAYAIYKCAAPEKRESIKPLVTSAALTAMMAGITEPLEFIFLFNAPLLFVVYALISGINWTILYVLGAAVGGRMASIPGILIYGILQPGSKWYLVVLLGIIEAPLMYLLVKWWITKFDVKTPGRGGDYDDSLAFAAEIANIDSSAYADGKQETDPEKLKAQMIIKALGGNENIVLVDSCMSRLRVEVKDKDLVDKPLLNKTGCTGIVDIDDNNLQIIYGVSVNLIKKTVQKLLK